MGGCGCGSCLNYEYFEPEMGSNTLQMYLIAINYSFLSNCNAIVFE